ncbi:MAG: ABC transporter ATP-binding protein [Chroococcidiopsidaceae cyanobacterium CP_BM_ER_R8_30]|nr:ABC transporter ATP-binding protein [Chroococcidiopsidaceae cyanobacterium CP_BM_ER_R8_30]
MTAAPHGIHLRLKGLRKVFQTQKVLQGIELEVSPGEFVAIVGQSGCGKSTLLRLISGLVPPTSGSIELDGERSDQLNSDVRMMFQEPRLLPWQSVLDNIELGLVGQRADSLGILRHKARQVLAAVGLSDRAKDWPAVLSGGQRQRVSLARALVSKPRLLLLDEPLGALDALTRVEMQQLLEHLWQAQGFTAFLITHDAEEAVALADRVVLIQNGRVALDIPVKLPRPRQRGNAAFVKTVETLIHRILEKDNQSEVKSSVSLDDSAAYAVPVVEDTEIMLGGASSSGHH